MLLRANDEGTIREGIDPVDDVGEHVADASPQHVYFIISLTCGRVVGNHLKGSTPPFVEIGRSHPLAFDLELSHFLLVALDFRPQPIDSTLDALIGLDGGDERSEQPFPAALIPRHLDRQFFDPLTNLIDIGVADLNSEAVVGGSLGY